MNPPLVLVTGAAGRVAQQLLPALHTYRLRLMDRIAPPEAAGADVVTGELTDRSVLAAAVAGVEAVVHLAGDPDPEADWNDLEPTNVDGFVALLEAAQSAGVRRVVFASSVHAMGQYEADGQVPINPLWPPAPCCAYGATKAFDEAIARVYANRRGVSTIGLRLGATTPRPTEVGQLPGWLGPEDLRQLVRLALRTEVRFGVYPGISANTRSRWDIGSARADLGYAPVLDSEMYADEVASGPDCTTCPPPGPVGS